MVKLIPLRIPQGWTVLENSFYDDEEIIIGKDGWIENYLAHKEDILCIQKSTYNNEKGYFIDMDNYTIDLGWYPDMDPKGAYKLVLLKSSWDNRLLEFKSKDKEEIKRVLEACLDHLSHLEFDKSEILRKANIK